MLLSCYTFCLQHSSPKYLSFASLFLSDLSSQVTSSERHCHSLTTLSRNRSPLLSSPSILNYFYLKHLFFTLNVQMCVSVCVFFQLYFSLLEWDFVCLVHRNNPKTWNTAWYLGGTEYYRVTYEIKNALWVQRRVPSVVPIRVTWVRPDDGWNRPSGKK